MTSSSAPRYAPSSRQASGKHNRSTSHRRAKYSDDEYTTADEDSGEDDLDRALAKIQACNERLRAHAAIPFPTIAAAPAVRHHHQQRPLHHARAPRDLPAQKPMPRAPLPTPPVPFPRGRSPAGLNVHKPLPRAPSPRSSGPPSSHVFTQHPYLDARASTDSLGPVLLYKGTPLGAGPAPRQELPPLAAGQKKTRTFGEFLQKAKQAGARVRKTSLDAYYAATDKAWELRVAAKYAGKDVKQAAGSLRRTVSREIHRGSVELRRAVSLSSSSRV